MPKIMNPKPVLNYLNNICNEYRKYREIIDKNLIEMGRKEEYRGTLETADQSFSIIIDNIKQLVQIESDQNEAPKELLDGIMEKQKVFEANLESINSLVNNEITNTPLKRVLEFIRMVIDTLKEFKFFALFDYVTNMTNRSMYTYQDKLSFFNFKINKIANEADVVVRSNEKALAVN
jgi:small nuclear ribonucleoprotein (snRNP)-like protein